MNELRHKYIAMKQQSIEMMQSGNINAYLAKLDDTQIAVEITE